ncbi:MAG: Gmad2 immunoglobulin-like domain-containing protein, partial [Chloroflexota bacterium]
VVQPALLPACTPRTDWTATYTVAAGDTLAAIGREVGVSFQALAIGNCLADASRIEVGQVLRVPGIVAPAPPPAVDTNAPTPAPDSFINITRADISVNNQSVTIGGDGQGLFEGNVVVELFDAAGTRLVQRPTTLGASEMGDYGQWDVTISVAGMATNNNGRVLAYSTSPRDGSVIASDEAVINFDFTNTPAGSIDIQWGPFDVMITPDVNNEISIGGYVDNGPNRTVRLSIVAMDQSTLPGTERTVTTDGNGYWWLDNMVMPAGYTGSFQIFATLLDDNGDVIVTDVQNVLITESVSAASQTLNQNSYTMTVPQDWFGIGDAGFIGYATCPPSNVPPGAGYGPYIMEIGANTRPYNGQTLEAVVAEIEEQVSNPAVGVAFTKENFKLADGTQAVLMAHTGGTGKRIYTLVFDSGQDFVVATALGNENVVVPLLLRMTATQ